MPAKNVSEACAGKPPQRIWLESLTGKSHLAAWIHLQHDGNNFVALADKL